MAPIEPGAALVRRLLAEIAADRRALLDRTGEVRRFSAPVPAPWDERTAALALALDRAYTSLESIVEKDLDTFSDFLRKLAESLETSS
jgi:hypothetical protein